MLCPKCGAHLDEDAHFCVSCGTQLNSADVKKETQEEPAQEKQIPMKNNNVQPATTINQDDNVSKIATKISFNPVGLIIGTIIIIIGINRILSAGTGISSTSFGADFYTYAYRGIVEIAKLLVSIAAIDVFSLKIHCRLIK